VTASTVHADLGGQLRRSSSIVAAVRWRIMLVKTQRNGACQRTALAAVRLQRLDLRQFRHHDHRRPASARSRQSAPTPSQHRLLLLLPLLVHVRRAVTSTGARCRYLPGVGSNYWNMFARNDQSHVYHLLISIASNSWTYRIQNMSTHFVNNYHRCPTFNL